jgi:hypothetical protein
MNGTSRFAATGRAGAQWWASRSAAANARGHHADGPQAGGGDGARERATGYAAAHPGLHHRALDPDLI